MKLPDRFMVIDDDPVTTLICGRALNKFSLITPVKVFLDAEKALQEIEEEYGVDGTNIETLLFLDINMPSITGWEFLDEFKDFNINIQNQFTIIILSSSIDEHDREKAESNSFVCRFISKPLNQEKLTRLFIQEVTS